MKWQVQKQSGERLKALSGTKDKLMVLRGDKQKQRPSTEKYRM